MWMGNYSLLNLLGLFIQTVFIQNILLFYFLGMCSYLACSNRLTTAKGLGLAVTFVVTVSGTLNWAGPPLHHQTRSFKVVRQLGRIDRFKLFRTFNFYFSDCSFCPGLRNDHRQILSCSLRRSWCLSTIDHGELRYTRSVPICCG